MRQKPASREPDGGLRFLEEKLSIYVRGSAGHARRNPALDLLTGRVPDPGLQAVLAGGGTLAAPPLSGAPPARRPLGAAATGVATPPPRHPQTLVVPLPAVSLAPRAARLAVAGSSAGPAPLPAAARPGPSAWLAPRAEPAPLPRIRFDEPPPRTAGQWVVLRGLLVPVAAAMVLLAGVGLFRGPQDGSAASPRSADAAAVAPPPAGAAGGGPATRSAMAALAAGEHDPAPVWPAVTLASPMPAPADQLTTLLDERFASNERGWPHDPNGPSWLADGGYHLFARQAARFVAVGVPNSPDLDDVVLSGTFRKTGGPNGGGYGLIVRDTQPPAQRDGLSQAGSFYVFEVGDAGEIGVWLRDADEHWVDLLPWTSSDVVKPATAANELTISALGDRLTFLVNGVPVASQVDRVLHRGTVGLFVGGDGNQVTVERLTVRAPR